jgi:hypothetical protein
MRPSGRQERTRLFRRQRLDLLRLMPRRLDELRDIVGNRAPPSCLIQRRSQHSTRVTRELLKLASPSSVATVRNDLVRGMAAFLDQLLLDPTNVGVAGVSPASITSTAPSFGSAGSSAANSLTDVKRLIADFTSVNQDTDGLTLIASPATATAIAIASNAPDLGPKGGRYLGIPFVTSTAAGNRLVAVDADAILVADDNALDVSVSLQGTVEMDLTPTSPITAGSVYVSLWQAGCAGIKIDRVINWKLARANSAMYTTVAYL